MTTISEHFPGQQTGSEDAASGVNPGISFSCPHCGQHLSADYDMAGLSLACPTCGQSLVVPSLRKEASTTRLTPVSPNIRTTGKGRKWRRLAFALLIVTVVILAEEAIRFYLDTRDPSNIRIVVRKMAPDQEMFNEIAYWYDKMDGGLEAFESAQKALLQEYDQVKLSPETLNLRDDFLATFEQVAILLQSRETISAQREQYIEQAKRQGAVQALSQIASGAQSQGEAGAWLALLGAAAGFADVEKGAAAQVDQAIAEINEKLKTCLNEFTRKQREYQKGKPYSSFDKTRIFDAQSFRMKYLAAQKPFPPLDMELPDEEIRKVVLSYVKQTMLAFAEMFEYKIPEICAEQFANYEQTKRILDTFTATITKDSKYYHNVQFVRDIWNNMEVAMADIAKAQYSQSRTPNSPIMEVFRSHEKEIDKRLFRIKSSRF